MEELRLSREARPAEHLLDRLQHPRSFAATVISGAFQVLSVSY
jgi:hypothetical protein